MTNFIYMLDEVSCGGGNLKLGDGMLPQAISTIVNIMKVAIPIMVVVFGLID